MVSDSATRVYHVVAELFPRSRIYVARNLTHLFQRSFMFPLAKQLLRAIQPRHVTRPLAVGIFLIVILSFSARAQVIGEEDENKLYAQSKQLNQFFRRFNGEEDEKGNRYYAGDRLYRSERLRRKYLDILFDESNPGVSHDLKVDFAKDVLDRGETSILDFHGGEWFAEVRTLFTMNGKDYPVRLFMELEKAQLGTKWSIYRAETQMFDPYFLRDTSKVGKFLHPLSHELDFMNLRKALSQPDSVTQFAIRNFEPDHLSVLLYELARGDVRFKSVVEVKFHFFQISGWYFEVSNFNREGYNTGWLISNLVRLQSEKDKDALKRYLYR